MTVATLHFGFGLVAGDGTRLRAPTADGTSGQVLTTDGSGQLAFEDAASGGTPGGVSGDIQYNDGGAFGGFWGFGSNVLTADGTSPRIHLDPSDSGDNELLKIGGAAAGANFIGLHRSGTRVGRIGTDFTELAIRGDTGLRIFGGTTLVFRADTDGHVVIGTTVTSAKFRIDGDDAADPVLDVAGELAQTAPLQRWYNGGNLVASIGAQGLATFPGLTLSSGSLQLANAAVSESITPTHTLQIKDSNGTAYKIPVVAA